MRKIILLGLINVFLFASSVSKDSVNKAIESAKEKYIVAKFHKVAWKGTKKKLQIAKKLLREGKLEKAVSFAMRAHYEAKTALIQSKEADATWQAVVPK